MSTAGREAVLRAPLLLARRFAALPGPAATVHRAEVEPIRFHDRPAMISGAGRYVEEALAKVVDPALLGRPLIGAIDQWVDSTDLLSRPRLCAALRAAYEQPNHFEVADRS